MNHSIAALALSWLVCAPAFGAEISTIETDVGTYEIVRLPKQSRGFELTDDREFGVEAKEYSQGQRSFRTFSVADASTSLFERSIGQANEWVVDGDRLVVAGGGRLETFSLPELEPVASVSLTNKARIPGDDDGAFAAIQRVVGGWYCDGYVFDRSGTRVEGAFYFRQASPNAEWCQQIVAENLRPAKSTPVQAQFDERAISASLETVPADIVVLASWGTVKVQIRGYDGGFVAGGIHDQILVDRSPAIPDPANPSAAVPSDLRVDGRDVTFIVGETGYHLRVQRFDAFSSDIPAPQRFAFKQPAMLLDDLAAIPRYAFIDGTDAHPARTRSCLHDQSNVRGKLEEEARLFLLERFNGRGASIAEFESRLAEYRSEASGEFERTVGRQPRGVPIPYRVEAETRWEGNGVERDKLLYCVWKEWPEAELVQLLFEDVLAESQRQELERKRAEIRAEQERERLRVIEEEKQRRLAEEQRRLAIEQERKERQHAALLQSLATRFRVASVLCLGGLACLFIVRVRSRKGATA